MEKHTKRSNLNQGADQSTLEAFGDLLTIEDLQRLTGISAQTLRAECRNGHIPSCKIGRRFFVSKQAFLEGVLNQRNQ